MPEGLPMLSLITNFSPSGDFEKIYLVMERRPKEVLIRKRRALLPLQSAWNGPALSLWKEV